MVTLFCPRSHLWVTLKLCKSSSSALIGFTGRGVDDIGHILNVER